MSSTTIPMSTDTQGWRIPRPVMRAWRSRGSARVYLAGAAVLVPWTAYLALSLPPMYITANWNVAWVGFDVLLTAMLVTTGVLAHRRHALQAPIAFATAALLVADAWFDITTSTGTDLLLSLACAALAELPLAAILIRDAANTVSAQGVNGAS